MGFVRQISQPTTEPVSLDEAKTFCKVINSLDDTIFNILIPAARQHAEMITGRCLAQRQYTMVLDSHPYYTDTIQSQLAYPPSYYSLPRYSTTLWNYSQMIKIPNPPLVSVDEIRSVKPDGTVQIALPDVDFVVDRITEYGRVFPIPGQFWPADLYVANAVEIKFTAGYDPDSSAAPDTHTVAANPPSQQPDSTVVLAVPNVIKTAILMLVAHWYFNREPVAAGTVGKVPMHVDDLLWGQSVIDFAPTRG